MSIRFPLGQIVITPTAHAVVPMQEVLTSIRRHVAGDWGNLCDEDIATNEDALKHGSRLFSAYETTEGTTFWIITEADRSVTTILLPEDH